MPIVDHTDIWYPNGWPGTAYDLTKVVSYWTDSDDPSNVRIRFRHQDPVVVIANKVAFLAALAGSAIPAPVITSALTDDTTSGSAYSYQITATNTPTSFNASPLPDGLSIDTGAGIISGTPTETGDFNITISATNAGGTGTAVLVLSIASAIPAPVITSALIDISILGADYEYQITATNTPTSFGASGLPTGLSVDVGTGAITGVSTELGEFNVTISATNAGGTGSDTLVLTISIVPSVVTRGTCWFTPGEAIQGYLGSVPGLPTQYDYDTESYTVIGRELVSDFDFGVTFTYSQYDADYRVESTCNAVTVDMTYESTFGKVIDTNTKNYFFDKWYTPPSVACGMIKMSSSHVKCIRIRNTTTEAELDIGFDANGFCDRVAIAAHADDGECTVVKLYSAYGGDFTAPAVSNQPYIYFSAASGIPGRCFERGGVIAIARTIYGQCTNPLLTSSSVAVAGSATRVLSAVEEVLYNGKTPSTYIEMLYTTALIGTGAGENIFSFSASLLCNDESYVPSNTLLYGWQANVLGVVGVTGQNNEQQRRATVLAATTYDGNIWSALHYNGVIGKFDDSGGAGDLALLNGDISITAENLDPNVVVLFQFFAYWDAPDSSIDGSMFQGVAYYISQVYGIATRSSYTNSPVRDSIVVDQTGAWMTDEDDVILTNEDQGLIVGDNYDAYAILEDIAVPYEDILWDAFYDPPFTQWAVQNTSEVLLSLLVYYTGENGFDTPLSPDSIYCENCAVYEDIFEIAPGVIGLNLTVSIDQPGEWRVCIKEGAILDIQKQRVNQRSRFWGGTYVPI